MGRPPATDSAETKRRILDTARRRFALAGYGSATNRELADQVGITAGALYHYFGSKLDLYNAVYDDVQAHVYGRFKGATEDLTGFLDQFDAVLDEAHLMNEEDPTLAAFLGMVRIDMRRHEEITEALAIQDRQHNEFFVRLVDEGVEAGDIAPEQRNLVIAFVRTVLVGLTDGVSDNSASHQLAIDSIKLALRNQLLATS